MGQFAVGEVVLVAFPYADLSRFKIRPALVLAQVEFDNLILCQITSKEYTSQTAIKIKQNSFTKGGLPVVSFARPDKIFTVEPSIIKKSVGQLTKPKTEAVLKRVRQIFTP